MDTAQNSEDKKIIVFSTYGSVITANLAKTKLDAYGIPCFLSDENLAGLYPLSYFEFGHVRLHIFEEDKARVKEVLEDDGEQSGTD